MESIMQRDMSQCLVCRGRATEVHHIMNGAFRSKSEDDGLVAGVCRKCHRYIHDHPATAKSLKAEAERHWLKHYGKTTDEFIERYGKNYL